MNIIDNKLEGITVVAREDEPIESLIKRFKKKVMKSEILKDIKRHMYYEKPSRLKKIKRVAAASRKRKEEQKNLKGRNKNENSSDK